MSFSSAERRVAMYLDAFPAVKRLVKMIYQRANYWLAPRHRNPCDLSPAVALMTQAGWAGVPDANIAAAEEFFGYYDKTPWSPDQHLLLAHRRFSGERFARLLIYDRSSGMQHELARTTAWNFQQGSMAQWLPGGNGRTLIFNDVADGELVSRIMTMDGVSRILPFPVQAVRPDGHAMLSLNYRRLARIRPEYGYDVEVANFSPDQPLSRDGLWHVDLSDGRSRLLVSLESLSQHLPGPQMRDAEHKVNHAVYSPRGTRFVFMHRWLGPQGKFSRLYCARSDGSELQLLLDKRMVSHYTWRDENSLLAWARSGDGDRYYLIDVTTGVGTVVAPGVLDQYGDGHPSYSPDRSWLVTDTYPDRARRRHLSLYHPGSNRLVHVGQFFAPWRYDGAERCDLHPRWSPDGHLLSIDSAHEGRRRSYVIDVRRVVDH